MKLWRIVRSRFLNVDEEALRKKEICDKCPFNTKNSKKPSIKTEIFRLLSQFLTIITWQKDKEQDWGVCKICGCELFWKILDNDKCPKNKW